MLNVIPRDGGNQFTGTMFFSGANGSMQGSNYTDELRAAGLRSPQELKKVYDFNPMGGGRIIRDKLWFYLTYREVVAENTIPGMFFNKNAGDPDQVAGGLRHLAARRYADSLTRNGIVRLTWQASPRNKISLSHSEQYDRQNKEGGGSATRTPEAQGMRLYTPGHIQTATWTSPFTNRLLLEAGWGNYLSRYANTAPRIDGTHNDALISIIEQCSAGCPTNGGIPEPDLPLQPAAAAGVRAPSDRHAGADAGVGVLYPRLAQHRSSATRATSATRARATSTPRRSSSSGSTTASPTS